VTEYLNWNSETLLARKQTKERKTTMKTALAIFAGLFLALASLAFYNNLENNWKGAPNALHNVMQNGQELQKSMEFKRQIAAIDATLPLECSPEDIANHASGGRSPIDY
jgi:hypothetical protein